MSDYEDRRRRRAQIAWGDVTNEPQLERMALEIAYKAMESGVIANAALRQGRITASDVYDDAYYEGVWLARFATAVVEDIANWADARRKSERENG